MGRSGLPKSVFGPLSRVSAHLLGWIKPHDTRTMFPNSSRSVPFQLLLHGLVAQRVPFLFLLSCLCVPCHADADPAR